jgi:DNA-binding FadR family transcriptional regulator
MGENRGGAPGSRTAQHIRAAEAVGRKIVSGELKPGTLIPNATDLARQMLMSRPAMREAIKLLAGKGLVESTPRRGTIVRPRAAWNRLDPDVLTWQMGDTPSAAFVRDLYELRRIVEPEAAALAATRATSDRLADIERALLAMGTVELSSPLSVQADVAFHLSILIASGNDFLASFAPAIRASLAITIKFQRRSCPNVNHFVPDHKAIVDAIRRGDPDGARAAVRKHLAQAEIDANEALKASGPGSELPAPVSPSRELYP